MTTTYTQATPKPPRSCEKQMEALLELHKAVLQKGLGEINIFEVEAHSNS